MDNIVIPRVMPFGVVHLSVMLPLVASSVMTRRNLKSDASTFQFNKSE